MGRSRRRDLLIILNPRRIQECLDSFNELRVDKLWIRNLTESQIEEGWGEIMAKTAGYDWMCVISDDAIVRKPAFDAVRALSRRHPVVTGYSTLDSRDWRVNLTKEPLADPGGEAFNPYGHVFYQLDEVLSWPTETVPTFLCGFTVTGMSRDLWVRYPFQAEFGSDTNLCRRLNRDRVPIVAAREGFCWHVKETWNQADTEPRKRLLIGEEPPSVDLEA